MDWKTIERPGHFGNKRDELFSNFNQTYGKENWRIGWQWGNETLDFLATCQIYEDAYYEFFRLRPEVLEWIVTSASDVYDDDVSNVKSARDYSFQETNSTHLQDIAVRRCVMRFGREFSGNHLIQIRGIKSEGNILVPYRIPFHLPDKIISGELINYGGKGNWWKKKGVEASVEEFYQQNKVLQVRDEVL